MTATSASVVPSSSQPPLPLAKLVTNETPQAESLEMEVVFVGGGPAGLAGAIELANLVRRDNEAGGTLGDVQIGVLEKAGALGEHCLSGAVVNPRAFRELFPELKDQDFPFRSAVEKDSVYFMTEQRAMRIPVPPTMHNGGNYIGSLSEMVRWLGERAEALGVNVFPGFPAASLLVDGQRVIGVRTAPSGLTRSGEPQSGYQPATDVTARITALAEGTRGALSQAWYRSQSVTSANPQIFALGVKELWEARAPFDRVVHTLGWPLPPDAFGGSFLYPMGGNHVAIGLVVGLDYHDATLDVHELLQRTKQHPLFRPILDGGELIEWGAKTIPEGGYYALPDRLHGDGIVVLGDCAGLVDVPSLKGIHYAMHSGMLAARTIFAALKAGDTSAAALAPYDRLLRDSYVLSDMHRTRNMRLAFRDGFWAGGVKAGIMTVTGGRFPGGRIAMPEDAAQPKTALAHAPFAPDGKLTFSKLDAVFKSGNATRDDGPSHLVPAENVGTAMGEMYTHMCPAGVYEMIDGKLRINAANCVDCKATDVLGPRWLPREGGSGPKYRNM
jgi:electron-transferring-flavoprotein dehydrogenase